MESEDKIKAREAWLAQNKKFLDDIERKKLFLDRFVIVGQLVIIFLLIFILYRYAS